MSQVAEKAQCHRTGYCRITQIKMQPSSLKKLLTGTDRSRHLPVEPRVPSGALVKKDKINRFVSKVRMMTMSHVAFFARR